MNGVFFVLHSMYLSVPLLPFTRLDILIAIPAWASTSDCLCATEHINANTNAAIVIKILRMALKCSTSHSSQLKYRPIVK